MAKKKKVEKDTSERWLLTYSDLMNLLLILFIILYTASKQDSAQFQQVAQSLREGFSSASSVSIIDRNGGPSASDTTETTNTDITAAEVIDGLTPNNTSETQDNSAAEEQEVKYNEFRDQLTQLLAANNLQDVVTVNYEEKGVAISFADNVLFEKSSAALSSSAQDIINKIGGLLMQLPYSYILVEGHADSDPIHNETYIDNMDLSTQRASNVWRMLVASGLPANKMASVGYGEYRPVAPNDTVENKAKNRRVVITILKQELSTNGNDTLSNEIVSPST